MSEKDNEIFVTNLVAQVLRVTRAVRAARTASAVASTLGTDTVPSHTSTFGTFVAPGDSISLTPDLEISGSDIITMTAEAALAYQG